MVSLARVADQADSAGFVQARCDDALDRLSALHPAYLARIERLGAKCWTLDIDPSARWWGHPQRHLVGDVQKVGTLYLQCQFDVALFNGVFGYSLNSKDGQNEAIAGLARVLKPSGMLMLGWNTHLVSDPLRLSAIEQLFVRSERADFERRVTFEDNTHVYDFFELSNLAR